MVTPTVINCMPALLIGIIIIALSVGFMVMRTASQDTTNYDVSTDQYQEQSDTDDSLTQTEPTTARADTRQTLDLSASGLTRTPEYVFSRTAITQLDLSNNMLDGALQAEVRMLQNLQVLNLSDNSFTSVPAEIGQLKNLEVLDLSNNQLTGLPYELGNLSNLQMLDLRGNAYSTQDLERIKETLPNSVVILVD